MECANMDKNIIKIIEWDENLKNIDIRAKRIAEIIKAVECKKPGDIKEHYLKLYGEDDVDYWGFSENDSYFTKALHKIPNLVKPQNKDDVYSIIEGDEDDRFYSQFHDLIKDNRMSINEVETIRIIMPRTCYNDFIQMIEKQFTNIIKVECNKMANEKKAVYITYTRNLRGLKAHDDGFVHYDPSDFIETLRIINKDE